MRVALAFEETRAYLAIHPDIARLKGWRREGPAPKAFVGPTGDRVADIARLIELIEPEAAALGLELVRVRMMQSEAGDGGEALQVMAEDPATGQLIIDQCAALSRRISEVIDAREEAGEVLIDGAYHLEVSSPGIDRPLTREKDFVNWAGHEARIVMDKDFDGQRVMKGVLQGIAGDGVTISDRKAGTLTVPRGRIHTAQLVLTDALIAATKPIDTTGAEEELIEAEED